MHRGRRRNNFHRSARWPECVAEAGLPEGFPVPRSAPHRKHVGGLVGGEHEGADASDGASHSFQRWPRILEKFCAMTCSASISARCGARRPPSLGLGRQRLVLDIALQPPPSRLSR